MKLGQRNILTGSHTFCTTKTTTTTSRTFGFIRFTAVARIDDGSILECKTGNVNISGWTANRPGRLKGGFGDCNYFHSECKISLLDKFETTAWPTFHFSSTGVWAEVWSERSNFFPRAKCRFRVRSRFVNRDPIVTIDPHNAPRKYRRSVILFPLSLSFSLSFSFVFQRIQFFANFHFFPLCLEIWNLDLSSFEIFNFFFFLHQVSVFFSTNGGRGGLIVSSLWETMLLNILRILMRFVSFLQINCWFLLTPTLD